MFFLLSIGDFTGITFIKTIAGWGGLFCGASAVYTSFANIVNGEFGKNIMPV